MASLLVTVRFHEGRYHGDGAWPPAPARLFQALVAGAARGASLPPDAVEALRWLETLAPPRIAAPPAQAGQTVRSYVPNNDLDAKGADPAEVANIRAPKQSRPMLFDVAAPLVFAWRFEPSADAERCADAICEIADHLYQLGRGVDMAWAAAERAADDAADARLQSGGALWRPGAGGGRDLPCPRAGSLASLQTRHARMRARFRTVKQGKKSRTAFAQPPKPDFATVSYESPSVLLLFDIRQDGLFAPQPLKDAVDLATRIRDAAAARMTAAALADEARLAAIVIGRDANDADKARRLRITPLPSIGHPQTTPSIRRVLVTVPPDCPIAARDVAWAFSGLAIDDGASLVPADDETMLAHYGAQGRASRVWRTVTPAALPQAAARRRIDPQRLREEAKGGAERLAEEAAALRAARQALRHAGLPSPALVRVRREPFEPRGRKAEAFGVGRFAKERLWHVELAFERAQSGPLLIGDGRYLGLGLMAPVRRVERAFAFQITDGLTEAAQPLAVARALRRAVMARAQETLGPRTPLPAFFTGHEVDGAPARSGEHDHPAFVFDAARKRLLVVAPHALAHRKPLGLESRWLDVLDRALDGLTLLRAGAGGALSLRPIPIDGLSDPLFSRAAAWETLTPYRVTRHARLKDAAAALAADLLAECLRAKLPAPQIDVAQVFAKPREGLCGHARLRFRTAVAGPILLGRDRHFGGGLFAATD